MNKKSKIDALTREIVTMMSISIIACFLAFVGCKIGKFYKENKEQERIEIEKAEMLHYYPISSVVVVVDTEGDFVQCHDCNGNIWEFEGAEGWKTGDGCSLLMYDNNTTTIRDDVIISATYYRVDVINAISKIVDVPPITD